MSPARSRPAGPLVLAVVAAVAHLVVGYFYLASGLLVPGYALFPLWIYWVVLAWLLVRLARRRSWWTPVVPAVAFGTWLLVLTFGERVLGWTG